jgi:hypothetical protein
MYGGHGRDFVFSRKTVFRNKYFISSVEFWHVEFMTGQPEQSSQDMITRTGQDTILLCIPLYCTFQPLYPLFLYLPSVFHYIHASEWRLGLIPGAH